MKVSELKSLPPLNIPLGDLRMASDNDGNLKVFDILRKKFVVLSPEEFVRQNFVQWLNSSFGYPFSLMANEVSISLNDTKKRCDTVVFGSDGSPLIIVEYKAPDIAISQETFDQIARYNMELKAKYLIVSNGRSHYCCKIDYLNKNYHFIKMIPTYREAATPFGVN